MLDAGMAPVTERGGKIASRVGITVDDFRQGSIRGTLPKAKEFARTGECQEVCVHSMMHSL